MTNTYIKYSSSWHEWKNPTKNTAHGSSDLWYSHSEGQSVSTMPSSSKSYYDWDEGTEKYCTNGSKDLRWFHFGRDLSFSVDATILKIKGTNFQ